MWTLTLMDQAASINSVGATVIAITVSNQVAAQIAAAMSFSEPGPSKGASIHQLIGAVQFLNIFGKMFENRDPYYFSQKVQYTSNHRRGINLFQNGQNLSQLLEEEQNKTISAALEFRYKCALALNYFCPS